MGSPLAVRGSLEHQAWPGLRASRGCVRSCASFAAAPESHLRTVRAPCTTSKRPILGYLRGCWLGQFWGTVVHVGFQRMCVWRLGLAGAVWYVVNLVAGGQNGWVPPGRSGRTCAVLFRRSGGRLGVLSGTVCLEPFLLLPRLRGGSPGDRWGWGSLTRCPLLSSPLVGL